MKKVTKKKNRRVMLECIVGVVIVVVICVCFMAKWYNSSNENWAERIPPSQLINNNQGNIETDEELNMSPHVSKLEYDKTLISPLAQKYYNPNKEVYQLVFDAVDQFKNEIDVRDYELSEDDVYNISQAVLDRSEFVYLSGISFNGDKQTIDIYYLPQYTKESAMKSKDAFRESVITIMNDLSSANYSDLELVLKIYTNLSKNTTYNEQAEDIGPYGLLVNKEGVCTGYAYSIRYLLDQLGIENYLAFSNDESHVWNIVNINNKYYHIDATWENSANKEEPTLVYFGQNDETRKHFSGFDGWYTRINSLQEKQVPPICTDTVFQSLSDSYTAVVNYDDNTIIYSDYNGQKLTIDYSALN